VYTSKPTAGLATAVPAGPATSATLLTANIVKARKTRRDLSIVISTLLMSGLIWLNLNIGHTNPSIQQIIVVVLIEKDD
jgi:hypothetical protein